MRLRIYLGLFVLVLVAASISSAATNRRIHPSAHVPQGFVGVNIDGPMILPSAHVDLAHQFDVMVANGVQSVRLAFSWVAAQPYASWAEVPAGRQARFQKGAGGVPTDFSVTDQFVELAAQRGLNVLPTVLYAPGWDAGSNRSGGFAPPKRTGPYADYLTTLIRRYGPHGSFWSSHRAIRPRAIRMWQIWNEPNLSGYWPQPFASSYVGLLRAAHGAIKRADPGAKVVLGALTNTAWKYLGQVDRIRGARSQFDVISVNGFTSTPNNVMLYLQLVRRAANQLGDRKKPLLATEFSWPSALHKSPQHFDWNVTEAGQARNIGALLPMLAARRSSLRLLGFYYYSWMGDESLGASAFEFAGLLRYQSGGRIVAKPALAAYRRAALALEGCRRKGSLATRCLKR
ncbi:MAG: hypothetical protein WBP81_29670 [Solirubrobacteraceae bacterium]